MHDYHFLLSGFILKRVKEIASKREVTNNSLIREFVEAAIWHIDYLYQNYGEQVKSKYESATLDGIYDIHIQLRYEDYKRIKWLHSSFNTFSLAQVVRRCIVFMIFMIEDYGSFDMAMKALRRMDEVMQDFEDMKDKHGFIIYPESLKIRHMRNYTRVTYEAVVIYVRFMKILLFGLPIF